MDNVGRIYGVQRGLKRFFDIFVSSVGLILLSPFLAALVIAVIINSKGPAIYSHKRVGRGGRIFNLYKFRSMVSGGDDASYMRYLQELIESEQDDDGNSKPYRKMTTDPRVTSVGHFLRTFYLDELPQLWNVLRGDMSLVGPRPHVQFEVDHYTPEQRRRLSVKPGLTGLWQVAGKADCTFSELIALDLDYIDHWNLAIDIQLVWNTFRIMLRGGEGFWARMTKNVPQKMLIGWIRREPITMSKLDATPIQHDTGD